MNVSPLCAGVLNCPHDHSSKERGLIATISQVVGDLLVLIYYVVKHVFAALTSIEILGRNRVFKGKVLVKTQNYGKFKNLWNCVHSKCPSVSPHAISLARRKGFIATPHKRFSPYGGVCFGAMMLFSQRWFETEDMERIAQEFKGKVPHQAVHYHAAYMSCESIFYPELVERVDNFIKNYHPANSSFQKEFNFWMSNREYRKLLPVLHALKAYLDLSDNEINMLTFIKEWALKNAGYVLDAEVYASVREVTERHGKRRLTEIELEQTLFSFIGLDLQPIVSNATPGEVLRATRELEPGVYKLNFPVYSSVGIKQGYHTTGFVVTKERTSYSFDINRAISDKTTQEAVTEMTGRIFKEYTGLKFSENLDGKKPGSLTQVGNFFLERANPPSEIDHDFDLCRITPLTPKS